MSPPPAAARAERPGSGEAAVLDSAAVREALGLSALPAGTPSRRFRGVSTDTRTLEPGALFVALQGERHDAADFLGEAAARGAAGAVVPRGREEPGLELEYFPVADTQRALGELARWRRRRTRARVVGITGSSGKTTVKEMVAAALSGSAPAGNSLRVKSAAGTGSGSGQTAGDGPRVFATPGNLNSLVGLPLTVLNAPEGADIWVLELGSNAPGEIATLTGICEPDHAVVTTVGPAHLEFFGDVPGVLREKLELVRGARPGGSVVVGERPPELAAAARKLRPDAVVAGLDSEADFRPDRHGLSANRVWFERGGVRYEVEVGGMHHLRDALLAAAVADSLGVPAAEAARGLAGFRPLGMRSALRRIGGLTVLVDCYNANPESFDAAIDYLTSAFPDRRRVAIVGTMLEMGDSGPAMHRGVAAALVEADFALVAATGEFAPAAAFLAAKGRTGETRFITPVPLDAREAREAAAADPETVWPALAEALHGDEVVLVKGSRGVRLERLVTRLERRFDEEA